MVLFGPVVRPSLKDDAERVVKKIEGVEHVKNQIQILPPSPMDDRLRAQLFRAIYGYPSLQRYGVGSNRPIHIIVNRGHARSTDVIRLIRHIRRSVREQTGIALELELKIVGEP